MIHIFCYKDNSRGRNVFAQATNIYVLISNGSTWQRVPVSGIIRCGMTVFYDASFTLWMDENYSHQRDPPDLFILETMNDRMIFVGCTWSIELH